MLSNNQLDHFRERQLLTLMDTCKRLVHSYSTNDTNEQIDTWTLSDVEISCGVEQKTGQENRRDKDTVISYDAIIRFAIGETFNLKDKIRITKRFGEAIDNIDYEIVAPEQRGPSGVRYQVKKVEL